MPPATGAPLLRRARALAALAVLTALAACGGPGGYRSGSYAHRDYPRPGPPEDPWRPYIQEAASRFGVPEQWVRAVMRQESGGRDDAISLAGAMGLMQVMPETYEMLRARYGLGEDPYEPHDNIMAGTAYIREMYDRYGAPGFLAAYNAGPNRLDSYLSDGTPLPEETVGYVSSIAPNLGDATRFTGPLSVFAGRASAAPPVAEPTSPPVVLASSACDPDAAYDPDRPCAPSASAGAAPPEPQPVATASSIYVPPPASAEPVYSPPPRRRPMVQLASLDAPATGGWAIQVGAFLSPNAARAAAADARRAASYLLAAAPIDTPPTTPFGGAVLYRARLAALTPQTAAQACARLSAHGAACITVPPGG